MLYHGALLCSESNDSRFSCIDYIGDLIAVGNTRGAIFFYRLLSKATRLRPELALHVAPPANDKTLNVTLTCIRFSPCHTYLAVGTASGTVLVFNLKDKCRLDIRSHHDDHRGKAISALCWSHDSSKLFSGCIGGVVIEFIFSDTASDWGSKSTSTSAMALNFASVLLMGKKNTTLICECEQIIRQIECTYSESCSCGAADILLVSVDHHSLLFQLPVKKNLAPRFCDIPLHDRSAFDHSEKLQDTQGNEMEAHFNSLWCASCFSNSYMSSRESAATDAAAATYGPIVEATGIIIAKSCETGIELTYTSLDGEILQSFRLKGPYRKRAEEESWDSCCLGVRCLTSFGSNSHKHLLTLITTDNCVMLINLRDMSCDYLMSHFDYSVHAAVCNAGRLLILYEDVQHEMMMADLIECLSPTSARPPLKIFDIHLHLSVSYMKRSWRDRKRERERERESPAILLTPTSTTSFHTDNSNAFLFYEPASHDCDTVGSTVMCGSDGTALGRCSPNKVFSRSVSDIERGREAADYAMRKKMDDLEDDLNHALAECDEELEARAFSGTTSSLCVGDSACLCCCHNGNSELGGGGGGIRSLDEIVKYGAILSASQGVCLSAEAIAQLSSLQHVLTAIDAEEVTPRQKANIGVGYDFYGLEAEDDERRHSLAVAARARTKQRRRYLKNILAESYLEEDSLAPLIALSQGTKCVLDEGTRNPSKTGDMTGFGAGAGAADSGAAARSSSAAPSVGDNSAMAAPEGDRGSPAPMSSDSSVACAADVEALALLARADRALRNTSLVLELAPKGTEGSVQGCEGAVQGDGVACTVHPWEALELADKVIAATLTTPEPPSFSAIANSSSASLLSGATKRSQSGDTSGKVCTFCGKNLPLTACPTAGASPPESATPPAVPENTVEEARAIASYSSSNGIGSISNSHSSLYYSPSDWGTADAEDALLQDQGPDPGSVGPKNAPALALHINSKQPSYLSASLTPSPSSSSPCHSPSSSSVSPPPYLCTPPSHEDPDKKAHTATRRSFSEDAVTKCESSGTESMISACATEEDSGPNPFIDSDVSWMEWWWDLDRTDGQVLTPEGEGEPSCLALKKRITRARRHKKRLGGARSCEGGEGELITVTENPLLQKKGLQRVVRDMGTVESLAAVRREEAPRNMYDIIILAPKGLGLNLALIPGGALVVRTFNLLAGGHLGPVERTGLVKSGDYLLGINGLGLIGLGLEQIAEILQNIDKMGEEPITLTFRFGDLYCMDETTPSPTQQHATQYRRTLSDSQFKMSAVDADEWSRDSLQRRPRDEGRDKRHDNPLLDLFEPSGSGSGSGGQAFTYDLDNDPLFGNSDSTQARTHHVDPGSRNGIAPAWVEDILLNPLSAVQVAAATMAPRYEVLGLESLGLGSWLDTMNGRRGGGADGYKYGDYLAAQYENNPLCAVAAVVDTRALQSAIRSRHIYPSAATVSCTGHESALASLSSKVAQELWQWKPYAFGESGYFRPNPFGEKMSPLIGSVWCVGGQGGGREAVRVDDFLEAMKHIEEELLEDRHCLSFEPSSLTVRAKRRKESAALAPWKQTASHTHLATADAAAHTEHNTLSDSYYDRHAVWASSQHPHEYRQSTDYGCHMTSTGRSPISPSPMGIGAQHTHLHPADQLQGLLSECQAEFSLRVRLAGVKRIVKSSKGTELAANLPPIGLTMRLRSLLCSTTFTLYAPTLLPLLDAWTQLFSPLPCEQRGRFSTRHISHTSAIQHGFNTQMEMAEFLCIMTDIVSLHFMLLFCPERVQGARAGAGAKGYSEIRVALDADDSPGDSSSKRYDFYGTVFAGEGGDRHDEGEEEDCSYGGRDLFAHEDCSAALVASCRLSLLPFRIDYSRSNGSAAAGRGASVRGPLGRASAWDSSGAQDAEKCDEGGECDTEESQDRDSARAREEERVRARGVDSDALEFLHRYGAYANLDLCACCCSLLCLPRALDAVLLVAGADEQLEKMSATLGPLFKKDGVLAGGVGACLAPILRPWNIKRTLFGDSFESILRNVPHTEDLSSLPSCSHLRSRNGNSGGGHGGGVGVGGSPSEGGECGVLLPGASRRDSPQSHTACTAPDRACSDALMVWQRTARRHYRGYLVALLRKTRRRGAGAAQCGVDDDIINDLLHVSLFVIEEDSRCPPSITEGGEREWRVDQYGRGVCHLSCCDAKYEACPPGLPERRGKGGDKVECMVSCLATVRWIVDQGFCDSAQVAVLCGAYGCFKEAVRSCKHHLARIQLLSQMDGAGAGGRRSRQVHSVLLRSLQIATCRLARDALSVCSYEIAASSPCDVSAGVSGSHDRGVKEDILSDLVVVFKLLWVSLARALRTEGGREGEGEGEVQAERVVRQILDVIVGCIMSSPLCVCPVPLEGGVEEEDGGQEKRCQVWEEYRDHIAGMGTGPVGTHTAEGRSGCEDPVHSGIFLDHLFYNVDVPPLCPIPPILQGVRACVSVNLARCLHTALGSVLTRLFVRALPLTVSENLHIDFICDLVD